VSGWVTDRVRPSYCLGQFDSIEAISLRELKRPDFVFLTYEYTPGVQSNSYIFEQSSSSWHSNSIVKDSIIDTTAMITDIGTAIFMKPDFEGFKAFDAYTYAFLTTHTDKAGAE
jgi:hypothetical protein